MLISVAGRSTRLYIGVRKSPNSGASPDAVLAPTATGNGRFHVVLALQHGVAARALPALRESEGEQELRLVQAVPQCSVSSADEGRSRYVVQVSDEVSVPQAGRDNSDQGCSWLRGLWDQTSRRTQFAPHRPEYEGRQYQHDADSCSSYVGSDGRVRQGYRVMRELPSYPALARARGPENGSQEDSTARPKTKDDLAALALGGCTHPSTNEGASAVPLRAL